MPIFDIAEGKLSSVEQTNFALEKDLQQLIEKNLQTVFNCRFVATEFSTGGQHAGRIDTLALSEENNPVIIEYKKVESSDLINQSLFYLHWIYDHKGDFEIAVQQRLGNEVDVDWSDIRVICIAPNYKKYDLHAVAVMGANIELWKYRLFSNDSIYLEEVFHNSKGQNAGNHLLEQNNSQHNPVYHNHPQHNHPQHNNPQIVTASKKVGLSGTTAVYTFDGHVRNKSDAMVQLVSTIRDFIMGIDESIEEVPKKYYIAYKGSQNIVCMEVKLRYIKLWLKLSPSIIPEYTPNYRDVSNIGHYGTGDVEFSVRSEEDFVQMQHFIVTAYNKLGG